MCYSRGIFMKKRAENAKINKQKITRISSEISKEIHHYADFSNELQRLNMDIYEMSYAILDNKWQKDGLFVPFNRIYYVCSGKADIFCNGKCTTITEGNAYILPADSNYAFKCENNLEKFYFHFNIFSYDNRDIFSSIKECIEIKNCHEEINFLKENWTKDSLLSVLQVKTMLYQTVCKGLLHCGISIGGFEQYSPIVKQTIVYINNNLSSKLKISDIAKHLFLSESYISKRFKKETNHSLKKYINDKILNETALALRHTNMTIKEISDLFGFCDQFHFSRVFSAHYGMPPKTYRRLIIV